MQRVFIGYLDNCGFLSSLCEGITDTGGKSVFLNLGAAKYGDWTPDTLPLIPLWIHKVYHLYWDAVHREQKILRKLYGALYTLLRFALTIWITIWADIIFLKSGESLYKKYFDLRLFKFFRKNVVFYFVGTDSRPPYFAPGREPNRALVDATLTLSKKIKEIEGFASVILVNPLSAHFFTVKSVPVQLIGNTLSDIKIKAAFARSDRPTPSPHQEGTLRILHAPSGVQLKGTDRIRRRIHELKELGYKIDYVEITGMPHARVLQEIDSADFVIDELYSDTHGAMFSVECIRMGKPSLVCGYGIDALDEFVPPFARLPTIFRNPDDFEESLTELVTAGCVTDLAPDETWQQWVRPAAVAQRIYALADHGDTESAFDPTEIRYFDGVGAPREVILGTIATYIEKWGPAALGLDDKPEMRDALIAYVKSSTLHRTEQQEQA